MTEPNPPVNTQRPARPFAAGPLPGEHNMLWVVWMTYGAFYFCRTNISAALPGMEEEFGFSKTEIGMILGSLKLAYGVGQFVNGQMSERISPRKLLAVGMLGSAALNVVFGFPTALYFLIFVWACNGYCQSLGWTPCVRVMANWVPARRRGKAIGIVGTGYQVTAALTFVVAGLAAERLGWRGAFYLPAGLLTAAAIHMLFFLRETPQQHAAADPDVLDAPPAAARTTYGLMHNLVVTVTNPALWALAIGLGLLNACRYGFLDWGLSHIKEVQGTGVATAAFKYAVLPLGGIAGSFVAGWATDRFFGSRRAPVVCILLATLGVLTLMYDQVARSSVFGTVLLLAVIGFTVYGPQVLLVGTAPADLARHGTAAAAAGFVNFMGYMGAFCGDIVTGRVIDTYGWSVAVRVWAGWAFGAAIAVAFLWNATARDEPVPPCGLPDGAAEPENDA